MIILQTRISRTQNKNGYRKVELQNCCIFIQLGQSHANVFVNNDFWLIYEHGIFEASAPTAVFAR